MVTPEPFRAPADALTREASGAHSRLFVVVVVCALSFGVLGITGVIIDAPNLERASIYCFIPIPITAYALARRHAPAIRTEPDFGGRFNSMGSIFGVIFFLTFLATVPAWESLVWATGAVCGGRTWHLFRRHRVRGRSVRSG